ncbi:MULTISPECIES: hypothetical protein [Amycolatopsis]|uniref:Uncharacterized protein n=1 Tax=Amycolatopsis saalfeldensis TaxID=394193 RepID=A0A1H8YPY0_9PSEU|nr:MULTISPECIES: hypothetical protein [Amycolatopsis]SEP54051.1 hypothetical protein SAMN04489732_1368 [Amycolatopsis saalfeldensis]
MSEVKLTKLTKGNIAALKETMTSKQAATVRLTATTAVFEMSPLEALMLVCSLQSQAAQDHGSMGHPYKSLSAVRRKLDALHTAANAETLTAAPRPVQKPPLALAELLRIDSDK